MKTIYLKSHKEESLKRFHPWVFSGAIARVVLDAAHKAPEPEEGELVAVRSAANEILGVGHWQIGSIAVRILAFGVETLPAGFWRERIRAAYQMREALGLITDPQFSDNRAPSGLRTLNSQFSINNTFRLIHGEGDFLPGLIVDVYAETAVIQAHSVGMHVCRNEIAEAILAEVPQVRNIYYKSDDTLPFKAPVEGERVGWLKEPSDPYREADRSTAGRLEVPSTGEEFVSLSTSVRTVRSWSGMPKTKMSSICSATPAVSRFTPCAEVPRRLIRSM